LPALLDRAFDGVVAELATRWSLTAIGERFPPTPGTPGNFVAPVVCADGSPAVLKISNYVDDTALEIAALRSWNGNGAARVLSADIPLGAMLLERIQPGTMLALENDDEAVRITADVLRQLWQPLPPAHTLRSLESWCSAYDRVAESLKSIALFQRADVLRHELLASTAEPVELHGDMHHFNVLRSDRAGWLAIDPKGLAGDRHFDVCQFLQNPRPVSTATNRRRLDLFSDLLMLDRQRLSHWCLVHAVLNFCWSFEEAGDWRRALAYAETTLEF
jgi:streptomycin 6-kinase